MQMPLTSSVAVTQTLQWKQGASFSASHSIQHREPHPPYAVTQPSMWNRPRSATGNCVTQSWPRSLETQSMYRIEYVWSCHLPCTLLF